MIVHNRRCKHIICYSKHNVISVKQYGAVIWEMTDRNAEKRRAMELDYNGNRWERSLE